MQVYLDNSATTKQSDEVTRVMVEVMEDNFGNPSSLHRLGVNAEKSLKQARKQAAALIGAKDNEVYFTSGGTESDNTSVFGAYKSLKRQGNHIVTTKIEHPAVLECFKHLEQKGAEVTYLDVGSDGIVDAGELERAVTENTILVSVMHVNNETGAVQPIKDIGETVKKLPHALFHCDAVQSYGKLPLNVNNAKIDLLSASAHKIHGPKGAGLFYMNKSLHLPSFMYGGGQEQGFRSGTENVAGIIGFGKAAELAGKDIQENIKKITELRDYLLKGIKAEIPDIKVNSPVENGDKGEMRCLPYVLNVSFLGTRGEVILHMLEQHGIYVSTGSACSSNKKGRSHVLSAMGLKPKEIESAVRFSFSPYNTKEEIEYVADKLKKTVADNRKTMKIANKMGR
ncbi:MAG: cysteine desulfurase [Firmicutes bacterium]|nr:cysteine desulfurase [Bacillota bacterium]